MDTTQLYRHFSQDGTLLYVGVSLSAVARLSQHGEQSPWFEEIARVEVDNFPDRETALKAERKAIETENPKYNKLFNARRGHLSFVDPAWRYQVERLSPVYRPGEAADALRISTRDINAMMERREIGFIEQKNLNGRPGRYITGWQLLEYIEARTKVAKRGNGHA